MYKGIQSDAQIASLQLCLFLFFLAKSLVGLLPAIFLPRPQDSAFSDATKKNADRCFSCGQDGGRRIWRDFRAAAPFSSESRHLGEILLLELFKVDTGESLGIRLSWQFCSVRREIGLTSFTLDSPRPNPEI